MMNTTCEHGIPLDFASYCPECAARIKAIADAAMVSNERRESIAHAWVGRMTDVDRRDWTAYGTDRHWIDQLIRAEGLSSEDARAVYDRMDTLLGGESAAGE